MRERERELILWSSSNCYVEITHLRIVSWSTVLALVVIGDLFLDRLSYTVLVASMQAEVCGLFLDVPIRNCTR